MTRPLGQWESAAQISVLREEGAIKREEEKEKSTNLWSWFVQLASTDSTSKFAGTDSTSQVILDCLDGTF